MNAESAYSRHLRIAAVATGFGSIIFSLLALGDVLTESLHLLPEFAWSAVILYFGLPISLIPLARWAGVQMLRTVSRVHTVVTLLVILCWVPAQLGAWDGSAPWILNAVAVSAGTAVVGWDGRGVWFYLVAVSLTGAALRFLSLGARQVVIPWEDGLSILEVSVVMAALLTLTVRLGRAQDVAEAVAVNDARGAAGADSRARQRKRFGALVHDDVISTLLAASQANRRSSTIERSARRAIARLDAFVQAAPERPLPTPGLLEVEVRSAVTDVMDGVRFSGSFDDFVGEIPSGVAHAITGALGEAARNSWRHAGTHDVTREVRMSALPDMVSVELIDDGLGFDLAAVSSTRFGIRSSIRDRMTEVGGAATVSSEPGTGTRVRIVWTLGAA